MKDALKEIVGTIAAMDLAEKVDAINEVREALHEISPFSQEPVDFVRWVKSDGVRANDYNPNTVAPPEMELLHVSIAADGYTQPIVGNVEDDAIVVVDGFHRHRVGKEYPDISERIKGYLPIVQIRTSQKDRSDRIASTIRHNRARGKHSVNAMSDIVIELKRRNWSDDKIAKNLGMDSDEVLRLFQVSGLSELFADDDFSMAWEIGEIEEEDIALEEVEE
jgi:ParB-like chromosome segregation protein Spo0J